MRQGSRARSAAGWLRRLDRRLGRLFGAATVLFEARTPMNLAVLEPVFTPLLHDARLDVRFTGAATAALSEAFRRAGVAERVLPKAAVKWRRVDLAVNADPWEAVRLRRVSRRMNFFHGVAGKYDLDCPTGLPLNLGRYDRIAFPNEGRLRAYVGGGLVTCRQAALVGYPKIDRLAHARTAPSVAAASLGLDPARRTAVFAPTFSPASALHLAGEAIIQTLLDSGCNVIVKLHDRSLDPDPRYSGGVDWRQRLQRFANGRHFLLADAADSAPYLLASDVMISDHSSIAFEFFVLDRPLVVFDAPDLAAAARINPEKLALLRSAADVVVDVKGLAAAVERCLAAPDAQAADRRRVCSEVFYRPGTATDRALRIAYELLELEPAPAHANLPSIGAWSTE